jgi:uncharacterized protein related to proFAR isomerase
MTIIPAIDLKDGQCVRLRQGLMEDTTVFSDNPVDMAAQWVEQGARRLHLEKIIKTILKQVVLSVNSIIFVMADVLLITMLLIFQVSVLTLINYCKRLRITCRINISAILS